MARWSFLGQDRARLARRLLAAAVAALLSGLAVISPAAAQTGQITPNWDDPEIAAFVQAGRTRAATTSALFDPRLADLKLPVLGFERAIPRVRSAFGVAAAPRQRRTLTMDPANPVWYELAYDYGDEVTITVEADLRIQQKLPPGTKLYQPPKNFSLGTDTEVAILREESEPGVSGAIAEFKLVKFGVTYTVTMECSAAKRAICEDVDKIRRDRRLLKIIFARPPSE